MPPVYLTSAVSFGRAVKFPRRSHAERRPGRKKEGPPTGRLSDTQQVALLLAALGRHPVRPGPETFSAQLARLRLPEEREIRASVVPACVASTISPHECRRSLSGQYFAMAATRRTMTDRQSAGFCPHSRCDRFAFSALLRIAQRASGRSLPFRTHRAAVDTRDSWNACAPVVATMTAPPASADSAARRVAQSTTGQLRRGDEQGSVSPRRQHRIIRPRSQSRARYTWLRAPLRLDQTPQQFAGQLGQGQPLPPSAGFNTYEGEGTGRCNGQLGATVRWKFTDRPLDCKSASA